MVKSSNVRSLHLKWSVPIIGATGSAVVVRKIVYMTGAQAIWAINETTGKTMALFRCTQMVLYPR